MLCHAECAPEILTLGVFILDQLLLRGGHLGEKDPHGEHAPIIWS